MADIFDWHDANDTRLLLGGTHNLQNDLNSGTAGYSTYNTGSGWTPIGTWNSQDFTGIFNGNGFAIDDLMINRPTTSFCGFFASIKNSGSSVNNLSMSGADVTGSAYTGTLAGYIWSGATVNNVSVSGESSGGDYTGGLAGVIQNNTTQVYECLSDVVVSGGSQTGGFVGQAGNDGQIYTCISLGTVSGVSNVGGFIGRSYGAISDSYSKANVTGASGSSISGFCGTLDGNNISNCWCNGTVSGPGVSGFCSNASPVSCFWDTEASGVATSGSGTGKTTLEMQTEGTFTGAGWDFTTIWGIDEGNDYPYLQVFVTDVEVPNIVGLSQSVAESTLTGVGLTVGTITSAYSTIVPIGAVISQDPVATTIVPAGDPVDFVVSLGHELEILEDFHDSTDGIKLEYNVTESKYRDTHGLEFAEFSYVRTGKLRHYRTYNPATKTLYHYINNVLELTHTFANALVMPGVVDYTVEGPRTIDEFSIEGEVGDAEDAATDYSYFN